MTYSIFQLGREAWIAGRLAIAEKTFIFHQTADDVAYQALKQFARAEAQRYLATLRHQEATLPTTSEARLIALYVHAFVIGALDELSQNSLL